MKNKLYTTYLSKLKSIDTSDGIVAVVMRFPPFIVEGSNMIHVPELAPSGELLAEYKEDKDFEKFETKLWEEFDNDKAKDTLSLIEEALSKHNPVYIVCCEKDYLKCHRSSLGKHFEFLGYEWEEII